MIKLNLFNLSTENWNNPHLKYTNIQRFQSSLEITCCGRAGRARRGIAHMSKLKARAARARKANLPAIAESSAQARPAAKTAHHFPRRRRWR
jgi:hypothetical protein